MKNRQTSHGMFSNIAYALHNIWMWDKGFCLFFIAGIPLAVLLPLAEAYFPKILIDSVESGQRLSKIILTICIYFGGMSVLNLLNGFCGSRLSMRRYNLSILYQHMLAQKHMCTDYSNTDNPEAITKYQHAMGDACSGQCAPEFICQSLSGLFISLLGILSYGSIIAVISPWILSLLVLSALAAFFIGRWQRNYTERHKDGWAPIDRKISYLQSFSEKFDYAKDIRIYRMSGWLSEMLAGFQRERFSWTKKVSFRSLAGSLFQAFLALLRNGAAYAVLIVMVLNSKISTGDHP